MRNASPLGGQWRPLMRSAQTPRSDKAVAPGSPIAASDQAGSSSWLTNRRCPAGNAASAVGAGRYGAPARASRAAPNRAAPNRAAPNRAAPNRAAPNRSVPNRAASLRRRYRPRPPPNLQHRRLGERPRARPAANRSSVACARSSAPARLNSDLSGRCAPGTQTGRQMPTLPRPNERSSWFGATGSRRNSASPRCGRSARTR